MKKKKEENVAMYFSSIEIENIKCFGEKQILDLKDSNGAVSPWTLILGDNGIGKTTLLKCIAWMIPVEESDKLKKEEAKIPEVKIAIKPFMDGFEDDEDYEILIRKGEDVNSRVAAVFTRGIELGKIPTAENLISHGINIKTKKGKLDDIKLEYSQLDEFNSPNLFAYGAARHMGSKNFETSELKDNTSNLFSNSSDLYDAGQLLNLLDTTSIRNKGKGKAAELLSKVKMILTDLLPYVDSPESILIKDPLKEDGSTNDNLVEIVTSDGNIPLFNLSLGYVTMLAWTVDLALRMLWHYKESENPLHEPAVVIVDEIDLHLHPRWQRVVRQELTKHFPRTQFICTAHIPFMAQSSEFENLCVINRIAKQAVIQNEPAVVKGWRIGQIITSDLFNISSERSPDIEKLIIQRRELLDKDFRTVEEAAVLKGLDEQLSKLPVTENNDDQKLLDEIRQAADLLRKAGKL